MNKSVLYDDGLILLDSTGLTIRYYYFPFATSKYISYADIKGVQWLRMGSLTGRGRLWGSGDFKHWASLDINRSNKEEALVLDLGKWVKPLITPQNPARVLALLQQQIYSN